MLLYESVVIGVVVGVVMGLTGAGGALVAIPLSQLLFRFDFQQATIFSLGVVIVASLFNFFFQRHLANTLLSLKLLVFSSVGSFLAGLLKQWVSIYFSIGLLILISLFSLFMLWKETLIKPSEECVPKMQDDSFGKSMKKNHSWSLVSIIGIVLGVLTTLTGLGGGVLLLPVLVRFFSLNQSQAVATSLLTIGCSACLSLILQVIQFGNKLLKPYLSMANELVFIFVVMGMCAYILKMIQSQMNSTWLKWVRNILFTLVVFLAIGTQFLSLS